MSVYCTSLVAVRITSPVGDAVISSVSIPEYATEVIITNTSTNAAYLALEELDLTNEYSRMELSATVQAPFRMKLPTGAGQLWITATGAGVPDGFISFWIV